ncbi:MAG: transketolase [Planctomycetaceae bacterium]|nr:transketolase [Planctomycetaceae bacterium]
MTKLDTQLKETLQSKAREIRVDIVKMLTKAQSGHPGGSLGMTDVFVSLYFGGLVKHDAKRPDWAERDRVVLSNGHICPVLYACLGHAGYFPKEWFDGLRMVNSHLQGHPAMHKTPGVEACTGSLGHGFAMAVGMALAMRADKRDSHVFALLGDGECQEGLIWEAAMSAAHYKLDNLTAIVDRNDAQIDGRTSDVMSLEPFADKWKGFGWHVIEIDGHDYDAIFAAVNEAKVTRGKPGVIIARTVMGKGVSYMEAEGYKWHGKAPSAEQGEKALKELLAST